MTEIGIARITFKTNENNNSFIPVKIEDEDCFIVKRTAVDNDFVVLQLTCENTEEQEVFVGMPFYEFYELDDTVENIELLGSFDFDKHFRFIGYDRYVLKADEAFISSIKTSN